MLYLSGRFKKLFFLIFLLTTTLLSNVQAQINKIEVIARAQEDKIMLRWAPKNFIAWHYLNQFGYTVERYTITRDSSLVTPPTKIVLHSLPFMPRPIAEWEKLVDTNDYAAIAAQVIYGETLELSGDYENDMVQIIHKTREQEQRFSFALLAADQSFKVAEMSGLGMVDLNAQKDEKYLYKVISNVPDSILQINEGTAYVGLMDHAPLPMPIDVEAEFGDRTVSLKWNRSLFERIYNSFIVERSDDDGITFKAISNKPLVNTYSENTPLTDYYYAMDSLPQNNKKYQYRVKGRTPFGETGPPSEIVEGMGRVPFKLDFGISRAYHINNEKVAMEWQVSGGNTEMIKEFLVERSTNSEEPFKQINSNAIPKNELNYEDITPLSTNYYRITAISTYDDRLSTFPYLVQLEDSIPPKIPVKLQGNVDSVGMVTLSWEGNTEPDLLGYRVYRSNFKNAEFGQITTEPVLEPIFTDSISINTLTSSIYYKVLAVDQRFNPSDLSEPLKLQRPDVIPPVPPVFKSIKSVEQGIAIEWINSSSEDVAAHVLYRNKRGEDDWNLVRTISNDTIQNLVDKEVEVGTYYNYTMVAIDSSKLESPPSNSVRGIKVDTGVRPKIENIQMKIDRSNKFILLQWEYNEEEVEEFLIYRKKEEEQLSKYTRISGVNSDFRDNKLVVNTNYQYCIKAVFNDGSESEFSDIIEVNY